MNVHQLKEKAKALGIEGADGMKKAELEAAIAKVEPPKSIVEKVKDVVDHVLHPDQKPEEPKEVPAEEEPVKSSSQNSDLAKHPKFAKFKVTPGGKP